jgi:hypothetical protein
MNKLFLMLLAPLVPFMAAAAPLATNVNGKRFGFCLGVDAHEAPPDMPALVNYTQAGDLGDWYEYEPSQGVYQPVWIQHELSFVNAASQSVYVLGSFLWGYPGHQGPTYNEPSWLAALPAATQIQEYIDTCKFLQNLLPAGSEINLISEPLHTNMSTVAQALGGAGATGWDGLIQAIKLARQYMPSMKIGIIDYNVETNDSQPWDPGTTAKYINLIQTLKDNGAMVDFIGCEGDFLEKISTADLQTAMQRLGQFGVPVTIPQLDISSGAAGDDQAQLIATQRVFTALWQSPYVTEIAFFATDPQSGTTYRTNDNNWRQDESHRPALNWLINYIPTSNPPNVFANPNPSPTPTPPSSASPAFIQGNYSTPQTPQANVSTAFNDNELAGDANIVVIGWNDITRTVSSVTDSHGDTYSVAAPIKTCTTGTLSQAIYYCANVPAGPNTIAVTFNGAAVYPDIRIAEVSNVNLAAENVSASGTSDTPSSGFLTPANSSLIISGITTSGTVSGAGTGFTQALRTIPDGDLLQYKVITSGPVFDSATMVARDNWVSQMVNFYKSATPVPTPTPTPTPTPAYPIKISADGRHFVDQNNAPFMLVGDSGFDFAVNLSPTDAAIYLSARAAQGFNSIGLFMLVAPAVGGNSADSTYDGIIPFTTPGDLSTPNPAYWARIDSMIQLAAIYGLQVVVWPIESANWGSVMIANGTAKCQAFGEFIGNRYKSFPNIIWAHGQDYQNYPALDNVMLAFADALKSADPNHLHTIELKYLNSASTDDANWDSLLGTNFVYTYFPAYEETKNAYSAFPALPVLLGETSFEGENNPNTDVGTPYTCRKQAWDSILSGGTGELCGNHYTWGFVSGWENNLFTPGAIQAGYLSSFFSALNYESLLPDFKHSFVTSGYGTEYTNLSAPSAINTVVNDDYVTAALTTDGALGVIYTPMIQTFVVNMAALSGTVTAQWYDPTKNTYSPVAGSPFVNSGSRNFTPPGNNSAGNGDWVLKLTVSATPTPAPTR